MLANALTINYFSRFIQPLPLVSSLSLFFLTVTPSPSTAQTSQASILPLQSATEPLFDSTTSAAELLALPTDSEQNRQALSSNKDSQRFSPIPSNHPEGTPQLFIAEKAAAIFPVFDQASETTKAHPLVTTQPKEPLLTLSEEISPFSAFAQAESQPFQSNELPSIDPATAPETITVKEFNVVGSTVFSEKELAEVTAPFVGRPITFAELLQARTAVTQLYTDQGYQTTGAFIPAGNITDGIVTIQVVEGSLEAIEVTGNRRLHSDYIRDRISVATHTPLNINRLLEALQLLQLNRRIETISAELSTGTRPGTNILQVNVSEAKTFVPSIILDNERFPSVGSFQRQLELREYNLTGNGDTIGLAYANTDGLDEIDFDYTYPVNPRNGTVGVRFDQIWSRVIEEPFDVLDLVGDSRVIDLTYRQPIIEDPYETLALGVTVSRRVSNTSLLGDPFPLSPGADEDGETRLTVLRLFQEWTNRGSDNIFGLRSEFSIGLPISATINSVPPDGEFFLWRGQAQWVKQFAPDTLFVARTNMQFADRPVVPFEQFGIGGLNSVRGYRQNFFLLDNGVFASVEGRIPVLRAFNEEGVLQVVPFIDFGTGWNNEPGRFFEDSDTVLSTGLGLRWRWSDYLSARVDFGIPLISVGDIRSGFEDQEVFFSVVITPF